MAMQEFLDLLRKGEFRVPVCPSCLSKVWPPSNMCPRCLLPTALRNLDTTGTLIEFSRSYLKNRQGTFGILDMEGIRIVGTLHADNVAEGMKMKLVRCGVDTEGSPFFDFEPI